jgi:hypothetical protein
MEGHCGETGAVRQSTSQKSRSATFYRIIIIANARITMRPIPARNPPRIPQKLDDFQRCQMRLVDQILEEMNTTTAGSPDLGPIKQVWCTNGLVLSDRKMSLRHVLWHHNYRERRNWQESNFWKKSSKDWLKPGCFNNAR